jgi:hypothetical protein
MSWFAFDVVPFIVTMADSVLEPFSIGLPSNLEITSVIAKIMMNPFY